MQQPDRFSDGLALKMLQALDRNLDELRCLQDEEVPDPIVIARIENARSLLNRASGLVASWPKAASAAAGQGPVAPFLPCDWRGNLGDM